VGRLFAPDMFSGWGVRTLSSKHIAYNPLSYHLGTVWPVENATIVFGLRRFGFDARALDLAEGMVGLTRLYESGRARGNASPGIRARSSLTQAPTRAQIRFRRGTRAGCFWSCRAFSVCSQ